MSKIYIYGAGDNLQKNKNEIPWGHVASIVDKSPQKYGKIIYGKMVISPQEMVEDKQALIVISSYKYYWDIREELQSIYAIDSHRIIGMLSWLNVQVKAIDFSGDVSSYETMDDFSHCLSQYGINRVISYRDCFSPFGVISLNDGRLDRWRKEENQYIDCCDSFKGTYYPYRRYRATLGDDEYDAVMFADTWKRISDTEKKHILKEIRARYIVFSIPYEFELDIKKYVENFRGYGRVDIVGGYAAGWIVVIDRVEVSQRSQIYVATHKKIEIPFIHEGSGFSGIFAGAAGKETGIYLRDDTGDNISSLNPWINECTALYWLWKHSQYEIIGFCHYRRFFLCKPHAKQTKDFVLRPLEAEQYLKNYDIIVSEAVFNYRENGVRYTMAGALDEQAVVVGMRNVRKLIEERHPDYLDAFDTVMHGMTMYPCNMFVTHRSIMDSYCRWLFSFIIDAAKMTDISKYDDYSKRIIGFIAERMLTVWLLKQNLRIKELPFLML
ncbi:DUF4422 domain-containing protein [Selenomonas montiformis]|uniref:DUF4422 domain-containing protein n=1 Tax=Selenomonas montiformis TaxID=2652285 RepID=UPI0039F47B6A